MMAVEARVQPPQNFTNQALNFIPLAAAEAAADQEAREEIREVAQEQKAAAVTEGMRHIMGAEGAETPILKGVTAIKVSPLFEMQGRRHHELCTH